MKNLRQNKIGFLVVLASLIISACTKYTEFNDASINPTQEEIAEVSGSTISSSMDNDVVQFPSEIQDYLNDFYPNNFIINVAIEENEEELVYEVTLNNNLNLSFDEDGNYQNIENEEEEEEDEDEDERILVSELPQNIIDYINANYPNIAIEEVELNSNGTYEVALINDIELYFDADGTILYIEHEEDNEDGEYELNNNDIPENVFSYINNTYPTANLIKAELENNGNYEIRLNDGIVLYFNNDGNFLYAESEFDLAFRSLAFPDTVTIGQVANLTGYIVNRSITPFNDNLSLRYGIEDILPTALSEANEDGSNSLTTVSIAPNDSIPFVIPITVSASLFTATGKDIVIVWPDVPTLINPIIVNGGGYHFRETYVEP